MRSLPGDKKKGIWGKLVDTVKAAVLPQKYIADTQRTNTDAIIDANAALEERRQEINAALEERRQQMQLAQLKMQYLQQQENREMQIELAEP
ncbi:MAG: hypothetical protein Fur0025_32740 [Oscillatoriaceae cyanobacterium]